ncbi:hypothetical protein Tco_0819050 [Tanacetum coccineum]|uniref:Uncharacterized protein n=1 Tax=Tanacetum coccineum TaxID=301880 RepID=A0ABQ5A6B6_9ASTR
MKVIRDSCTSKVDSEPPNGSNDDITNPYECDQTLNVRCKFKPRTLMSTKWRLLTTLQALLFKEKKGDAFSVHYLWKKENIFLFKGPFYQQGFMLFHVVLSSSG